MSDEHEKPDKTVISWLDISST